MRIGIIAHLKYPITEPFAGGLEMHTHLLASKLAERGHDVSVFCASGSTVAGALPICLPTAALSDDSAAYAICDAREHRAYLRIMGHVTDGRFDVLHNNSLHYLPLDMAGILSVPMVTTLHTPPFDPFTCAVAKASDHQHPFVAVSETIAAEWAPYITSRLAIPNGVDLTRFSFCEHPAQPPYAVWYGRIVPEKGVHLAIEAARSAGMHLMLAGPLHDRTYFDDEIAPRLGADVEYTGHLDHAELSQLIAGATVFLCTPRWEEPFGLVVAEALACGVPVAAFARGAIPRILDASSGALATADDVGALAKAALIASRLSRSACRRRAEMVCDAELMIDRYVDLYSELAGVMPLVELPGAPLDARPTLSTL